MVKLLACRASSSGLATAISEIRYLLLPGRDMTEILLNTVIVEPHHLCMTNFMNYIPIFLELLKERP